MSGFTPHLAYSGPLEQPLVIDPVLKHCAQVTLHASGAKQHKTEPCGVDGIPENRPSCDNFSGTVSRRRALVALPTEQLSVQVRPLR